MDKSGNSEREDGKQKGRMTIRGERERERERERNREKERRTKQQPEGNVESFWRKKPESF